MKNLRTCLAALALLSASHAAQAQPTCVYPQPEPCLYQSAITYPTAFVDFTLPDASRNGHLVPIRVRYPVGAGGARPVVLWNHGGATNPTGHHGSVERSESFAAAGYIVIHIARVDVANPGAADLAACVSGGVMTSVGAVGEALQACKTWLGFHVHGPLNNAFIASVLPQYQVGMLPGFNGTPDRTRMVVGGWSGGTESMLNIAGVALQLGLLRVAPTPIAGVIGFFGDAPRGPTYAGFNSGIGEDAYYAIDARPYLMFSGRGDETGEPAESRTVSWLASTPGGKLLSWDNAAEANHGTIDIGECDTVLRANHCRWMRALGVAFLDAVLAQRQQAIDWLASDAYRTLTGGVIELHRR
ncbi:hypothetical protein HLB44_23905 [Aquincola sp. S2]|uniref:Alpha/beta hydrolase n=1 Tax=Pseudaquabacterium terrae TaxID=2732868 RepID=A0ABX2EMY5_9BURK|nr:hypothetical protein [Aquabacterium terrae]NRF70054.1 hypothetical protein [Aquabacterium terrae]